MKKMIIIISAAVLGLLFICILLYFLFNKESRFRRAQKRKKPEEKYATAVSIFNSGDYMLAYERFKPLIGVVDGAKEYAERSLYEWYKYEKEHLLPVYHSRIPRKFILEVQKMDNLDTSSWRKELYELYSEELKKEDYVKWQKMQEDAKERQYEAESKLREMEEEMNFQNDYGDGSSTGTYDSIDLSSLPDMIYFKSDPAGTVYQHYGYMVGNLGQRVRVYMSLDGQKKVSISYAHNGIQVGRDYYTNQGSITKYGF